jgi:hypothetical protein
MIRAKKMDLKTGLASRERSATSSEAFYSTIRDLVKSGALLQGTPIEVERIVKKRQGGTILVTLDFVVPHAITETVDHKTGVVRASSDGARFTYTFTGSLSLDKNLREFQEFYTKRSQAHKDFEGIGRRHVRELAASAE